jgi:hypothetical protein
MGIREAWWRVVEDSKYGSSWGVWCSSELVGGVWSVFMEEYGKGWGKFCSHTKFDMGDGSKIRFWHDLWRGDLALKEAFSILFGIACTKDTFVVAHVEFFGGSIQWNMSFARAAHDWEVDTFTSFFRVLYLVRMRLEWEDKLWSVQSRRGLFGVKSFYSVMGCNDNFRFPWKSV